MVEPNTLWAEQQDAPQIQQFFIHESVLGSLVYDIQKTFTGKIASDFINAIPELKATYGDAVVCEIHTSFNADQPGEPVQILKDHGVILGDAAKGGIITDLKVMCAADETSEKDLAVELQAGLSMTFNGTFDDFKVYALIQDNSVMGAQLVSSKMDITSVADWNALLNTPVTSFVDAFNDKHATVINYKMKYSVLFFVSGIVKLLLATPFQTDHFIFAGFRWITDF